MKVILVQDVARLGRRSEIKDVPRGHALNFLIPRKLAVAADEGNLKKHTETLSKRASIKAELSEDFRHTLEALKDKPIVFKAPTSNKGHLFSGLSTELVATILKENGYAVDVRSIVLEQPIKEVGAHIIALEEGEVKGSFTLEVVSEK